MQKQPADEHAPTRRTFHQHFLRVLFVVGCFISDIYSHPIAFADSPRLTTESLSYRLAPKSPQDLRELFAYSSERLPLVSAHRGGLRKDFPENCLETFEDALKYGYTIFEVDPRLTKDGHFVLHHDATLDRTTTGSGPLNDKTLAELDDIRLRDRDGMPTSYKIPTLDAAIEWARGKAILVLDQKDVTTRQRLEVIEKHQAEAFVMMIVARFDEVKETYETNPDVMMEVFLGDRRKLNEFKSLGVPFANVIAFIGHEPPKDRELIAEIHRHGASCMAGTSRNLDLRFLRGEVQSIDSLKPDYQALLDFGIDVIETDIPTQLHTILWSSTQIPASRAKYFEAEPLAGQ